MEGTKNTQNNNAGTQGAQNNVQQTGQNSGVATGAPMVQIMAPTAQKKLSRKEQEAQKIGEASKATKTALDGFYSQYAKYNSDLINLKMNRIKESIKAVGSLLDTTDETEVIVPKASKLIGRYVESVDYNLSAFLGSAAKSIAENIQHKLELQTERAMQVSGMYSNDNLGSLLIKVESERKKAVRASSYRAKGLTGVPNGTSVKEFNNSKTASEQAEEAESKVSDRRSKAKVKRKESSKARSELYATVESVTLKNAQSFVLNRQNLDEVGREVVGRFYKSNSGAKSEVMNKADLAKLVRKAFEYEEAYMKSGKEYGILSHKRHELLGMSKDMHRFSTLLRRVESMID